MQKKIAHPDQQKIIKFKILNQIQEVTGAGYMLMLRGSLIMKIFKDLKNGHKIKVILIVINWI